MVFGFLLIRRVKKEVAQKEEIEKKRNQLEKANARLRQLDKEKSEFVSFASHQLRSPLTAIKGYSSMILEGDYGKIEGELKRAAEIIYESINTMTNVVSDYLNISRIELGQMKYDFRPMDFREIVDSVVNELKPNMEMAGLSINFNADQNEKYPISADPDKFKQVIMNIIDNSVKYTPKGSINISLTKNDSKKTILFTSKDTGVGIPASVMPKLFAKFTRSDTANKTNIRGTCLGLYIAKEIITAHKGKIWAESEGEGKGSSFYVEMSEV
jgi:hypothetical protein